jgi:hypothetical protein
MNLLGCNEDVVRLILGCLAQADLRSVCLVHPSLRLLAETLLYSAVELAYYKSKPHLITLLVRSILRRPELAAHIRTLSLQGGDPPDQHWGKKVPRSPVHEADLHEAVSLVAGTRLSYRDKWIVELRQGTLDAYIALLLLRLPRLRRLHLGPVFLMESELIGLVLRSILHGPRSDWLEVDVSTSLRELCTVSLIRGGLFYRDRTNRNTESTLPFFQLPSLEEMIVSIDNPLAPALPWPTAQPPSATSLVSLSVGGTMRESHLGQLLAATPCLRLLRWTWCYMPDSEDQYNNPVIDLDQLMPALAHVNGTLTELSITGVTLLGNSGPWPPALRVQGSTRALAGFDRLTKLSMPLVFFTGFSLPAREQLGECLPRNLEELTLTDDMYIEFDINEMWDEAGHTSTIVAWLEHVESSTPRLQKLCLVLQSCDEEISFEDLDVRMEIRRLARRAGIDVTTLHVHAMGTWDKL